MQRWLFFLYGVACHLLFLATFTYMACFFGNLIVPKTIDSATTTTIGAAIAIDLALIVLFALSHSIMARPAFKQAWTRLIPGPIERSTYVLVSCLVTVLLIWQWRGIDIVVWDVSGTGLGVALWVLFAAGWLLVPVVSLLIDHFDLFGTRQVWLHLQGKEYASLPFRTPLFYGHVRHPLYIGWTIAFWATPTMTVGHLLLAATWTVYMGVAAVIEERDLVAHFGDQYETYRRRVPMFIPRLTGRTPADRKEASGEV